MYFVMSKERGCSLSLSLCVCECVCRLAAIGYSGEVEDVVNVMSFRWFNFIDVGKRALGTIVLILQI